MEQARALNALEVISSFDRSSPQPQSFGAAHRQADISPRFAQPFVALSKSATSPRAAADLVTRATSAPNTFVFAELLRTPQIQSLASDPSLAPHLQLLRVFSYGSYQTYKSTPGLPALNAEQTLKLRQLSLLSLARDRDRLSYQAIQEALGFSSARQVEELAITAVYAGLLVATLDPLRQTIQVTSIAPLRDLPPGSIPDMIATLKTWSGRCTSTLEDLEKQVQTIRSTAAVREREKKTAQDKLAALLNEAKELEKKAPSTDESYPRRQFKRTMPDAGRTPAGESMDLDKPYAAEAEKKRASKRKM